MNRGIIIVLLVTIMNTPAYGFYSWQSDESDGDVRGLLRFMGYGLDYPAELQQADEWQSGLVGRLLAEYGSDRVNLELNIYQTWLPSSLAQQTTGNTSQVERSGALERNISHDHYARQGIDRLSLRWTFPGLDIHLGRQPINLATTFFFSPNDLFAPFDAQDFYRVYKAGVDGLRVEAQLGELSQLSLIGVLGYAPDSTNSNGWADTVDSQRHSYVARLTTSHDDIEWGAILGKVRRSRIVGLSIQAELLDWLGIRIEAHRAEDLNLATTSNEYSIGVEHRWPNSLMLQFEQYYHGKGLSSTSAYDPLNLPAGRLARRYQAMGLSYEFGPLLSGQFSLLRNYIDHSMTFNTYLLYSLSDEAELAISLNLARGRANSQLQLNSEYGSLPAVLSVELRSYF